MRRYIANDRRIANEVTAANVDAPERATYVVSDTNPTSPTDLEVGCDAGDVVVDGSEVSVSAQTASVSDISGQVTQTAYRYHTLSVDATGALVVRSSPVGEFDASDADAEPITQVTEPSHETGEVFIGTAFQVGATVERVFDGRYVLDGVPNSVITQGQGSGLDADTLRGSDIQTLAGNQLSESGGALNVDEGPGSGLDADTVDGEQATDVTNDRVPVYDVNDGGVIIDGGTTRDRETDGTTYAYTSGAFQLITTWDNPAPDFSNYIGANIRVSVSYDNYSISSGVESASFELRDQSGSVLASESSSQTGSNTVVFSNIIDVGPETSEQPELYASFANDENVDVTVNYFEWEPNHTVNTYIS